MRWSPLSVVAATGGSLGWLGAPGNPAAESISAVGIDSRAIAAGALFVALRAERDGHDFVGPAVEAGADAVLVSASIPSLAPVAAGRPLAVITVSDTGAALLDLGRAARTRFPGRVVGITGSVGKTSTKDLAAAALGAGLRTVASEKSFNNELGLPLTLLNAAGSSEVAVLEMGSRRPGHIALLCDVAAPDVGVVTAVAAAHTETFGDIDGVARAKGELVEALPAGGHAVLNGDDPRVAAMRSRTRARVITYSVDPAGGNAPDVVARAIRLDGELRPTFHLESPWGSAQVTLEARGLHQVSNALAALTVAGVCGVDIEAAAAALAEATLSPWRMEVLRSASGATILNDAYNANPASVSAALEGLAAIPAARRIAVLGPMAELGADSVRHHHEVAGLAARLGVEVMAVGTRDYGSDPVEGIDEAAARLGPLGPGHAVLVKASRVAGLEKLAALLASS